MSAETVNTYFFCALHRSTTLSIVDNAYYCEKCGCAPEQVVSAECPQGFYLVSPDHLPEPLPENYWISG